MSDDNPAEWQFLFSNYYKLTFPIEDRFEKKRRK